MESAEFISRVTTDPHFALGFIARNNLPALNKALITTGMSKEPVSLETAYTLLIQLYNNNDRAGIQKIISMVPVNTDATNETHTHINDLISEYKNHTLKVNFPPAASVMSKAIQKSKAPDIMPDF